MASNKIPPRKENPTTNSLTNFVTNTSHNLKLPRGLIIKWQATNVFFTTPHHNFYTITLHKWKPKLGQNHDDKKVTKNVKWNWN